MDGTVAPVFTETLPEYRQLFYLCAPDPWIFEPSSFYVIKKSYADLVGSWHHSSKLWRPPLRDWLMRAWRKGGRFSFGEKITGIRFWTQNMRQADKLYAITTPEHEQLLQRCINETPDDIRLSIEQQIFQQSGAARSGLKKLIKVALRSASVPYWQLMAALYVKYGWDSYVIAARLLFRPRGKIHRELITNRTGEFS